MSSDQKKPSWKERIINRVKESWEGPQSPQTQPGQPPNVAASQTTPPASINRTRFKSFILVPLPANAPDQFAKQETRLEYARGVAQRVAAALDAEELRTFNLLEIYTTPSTNGIIRQLLRDDSDPNKFEQICHGALGSARQQQSVTSGPLPYRVYLVQDPLQYDPAFDDLLNNVLLIRPLESGGVPVPKELDQTYENVSQILLGEVIIYDSELVEKRREEILAWRGIQKENYFTLHVDFDLLHRAVPSNLRPFPLGLEIQCTMDVSRSGKRRISNLVINTKEAKQWVEKIRSKQVSYYFETGTRPYRDNPLSSFPDDYQIDENNQPTQRSLGQDRTGQPIVVNINRDIEVVAERGTKAFHYLFNFFERGKNYTASNNSVRVSGQLIVEDRPVTVFLPPTFDKEAVPVFTLSYKPSGGFLLTALDQPLSVTGHGTVQPQQSCLVSFNVEITPSSSPVGGAVPDDVGFTLRGLQSIPQQVLQGKNYCAFLEIQRNEDSSLVAREHTIGSGDFFPRNTPGIGKNAIIFRRQWTRVTMEAGPNQVVWYGKDSPGANTLEPLTSNPLTLELNDYFWIYVGDFQLRVDAQSTPASE